LEVALRTSYYRRFAATVQEQTAAVVLRLCRPTDYSRRCGAATLLSSLILAAANGLSLAAVAALRPRSPCRETLRQALLATLPQYDPLRRQLGSLLRASLPRSLRRRRPRRRYPLAIDVHQVAYFKRQRTPPAHVRKGKPRPGTAYGHLYASASLLRKGQYYVVALTPYDPGEDTAALVRRLLRQAAGNGFSPRYVLMDRGFWSVDVFRYLQRARCPFLIPVPARGKKPDAAGGPTGTWALLHGRKTGRYTYRLQTHRRGRRGASVTVVVHRRNRAGQRGRHGRYTWAYALWRMELSSLAWVRHSYRRRFRIESSYRLLEAARGRTSSRDEGWRLWYVVLAVLMLNRWLELRRTLSRGAGHSGAERYWWNRLLLALAYHLLVEPGEGTAAQPATDPRPPARPPTPPTRR
jgi:putative transposase